MQELQEREGVGVGTFNGIVLSKESGRKIVAGFLTPRCMIKKSNSKAQNSIFNVPTKDCTKVLKDRNKRTTQMMRTTRNSRPTRNSRIKRRLAFVPRFGVPGVPGVNTSMMSSIETMKTSKRFQAHFEAQNRIHRQVTVAQLPQRKALHRLYECTGKGCRQRSLLPPHGIQAALQGTMSLSAPPRQKRHLKHESLQASEHMP